jgi:glycosyltransferase involved in cell wall biosynthesis
MSQVSIAMTSYNGARFIGEQLASLAFQTTLPAELVICDDGSTDATLDLCEAFAAAAPFPVRIQRNEKRLGYPANFIQAAGLCTAPLIAFCDQDDMWAPDKIARVQACFAAEPDALLLYHNAMLMTAEGADLRPFFDTPPSPPLAPRQSLPPWHFAYGYSQVFRRELLTASPYWAGLLDTYKAGREMGHDLFYFMIASTLGSILYVHEPLVRYRQHAQQAIGTSGRAAPGLWQRWRYRLENRRAMYRYLAHMAQNNASLFERWQAAGTLAPALSAHALSGAEAWRLLGGLYAEREAVCGAGSPLRRWRAWSALDRLGAYSDGFWTFGRGARWKDAVLGVILAPLVLRFGAVASEGDPTVRRGPR